jgi:hypothetical protein
VATERQRLDNLLEQGYIDITGLDVEKIVRMAFEMSKQPEGTIEPADDGSPMTDDELSRVIQPDSEDIVAKATYIRGRLLNILIVRADKRVLWRAGWFNHDEAQQIMILERCGLRAAAAKFEEAKERQVRR